MPTCKDCQHFPNSSNGENTFFCQERKVERSKESCTCSTFRIRKQNKIGSKLYNLAEVIVNDLRKVELNLENITDLDIIKIRNKVELLQRNTALTIDSILKAKKV